MASSSRPAGGLAFCLRHSIGIRIESDDVRRHSLVLCAQLLDRGRVGIFPASLCLSFSALLAHRLDGARLVYLYDVPGGSHVVGYGLAQGVLASWFQWVLLVAWGIASLYLVLLVRRPDNALGTFILPLLMASIALRQAYRDRNPFSAIRPSVCGE